jgi:hypothetical protein
MVNFCHGPHSNYHLGEQYLSISSPSVFCCQSFVFGDDEGLGIKTSDAIYCA